ADIDFAGKTGTAQVVSHSFGANKVAEDKGQRANSWFVGIAPRRNPDIVVVVFWQHGGWGTDSAHVAARVIQAFVDKQRRLDHNLHAPQAQPLDVGAVWSDPNDPDMLGGKPLLPKPKAAAKKDQKQNGNTELASARAGHF